MTEYSKKLIEKLFADLEATGIQDLSTRALFGGRGMCSAGIMFAQIQSDKLYLRSYPEYLPLFLQLKMEPLKFEVGATTKLLQYYRVTDQLLTDNQKLLEMVNMVIECGRKVNLDRFHLKEPRLKDLPNISLSLERLLVKVGIKNVDSLREVGVYATYAKLEHANKNLSSNILFVLYSALNNSHVELLSKEEKIRLIEEYQQFISSMIEL